MNDPELPLENRYGLFQACALFCPTPSFCMRPLALSTELDKFNSDKFSKQQSPVRRVQSNTN